MKILGIDPGTAIVGWGVVEFVKSKPAALAYGSIQPETKSTTERLVTIFHEFNALVTTYHPDAISVEDLYFATNAKTAISVGQARGVILLASALAHIPVISYSPLSVKLTVTGDGHADKSQVGKMVVLTLKLKALPKPDDTADALAIALTHGYMYKMKEKTL